MKRFVSIILAMILCLSLCACAGNTKNEKSVEDEVKDSVRSHIAANIMVRYGETTIKDITYYVNETSENNFNVTGKVTVKDKYGDLYVGTYDAVVEYDPVEEDCDVNCELSDLYRN